MWNKPALLSSHCYLYFRFTHSVTFISKSLISIKPDSRSQCLNLSLLILSTILRLPSIFQVSPFHTLMNLLISKSQKNQPMPLCSQHMIKTSFLANYISKLELKLTQPTFMVSVKDLSPISEKPQENGLFFQEIDLSRSITELEDKLMDFIHFIF